MKVGIIGGGISGLSLAYFLQKFCKSNALKITVLDRNNRLGGWIDSTTKDDNSIEGNRFDFGPKSIRLGNPKILPLLYMIKELEYTPKIITPKQEKQGKYIYFDGKLNQVSLSNLSLFEPSFIKETLINCLVKRKYSKIIEDISVFDYFSSIFPQKFVDRNINPIFYGIYASDSRKLSLEFCLPHIWDNRKRIFPPLLKATQKKTKMDSYLLKYNFDGFNSTGMISTISGLSGFISMLENSKELRSYSVKILKDTSVTEISYNSGVKVSTSSTKQKFDHVFSTIPTYDLKNMIDSQYLRDILSTIRYSSVTQLIFEYSIKDIEGKIPKGFGFVTSPSESDIQPIIGTIFDSNLFKTDQTERTFIITIMMGGDKFEEIFGASDLLDKNKIYKHALNGIHKIFGWNSEPLRFSIRVFENCIPIPEVGHKSVINEINKFTLNSLITISGAAISGPAIPDCIYQSYDISRAFLRSKNLLSETHT